MDMRLVGGNMPTTGWASVFNGGGGGGGGGLVLRGKGVAVGQACQVAYRILLL